MSKRLLNQTVLPGILAVILCVLGTGPVNASSAARFAPSDAIFILFDTSGSLADPTDTGVIKADFAKSILKDINTAFPEEPFIFLIRIFGKGKYMPGPAKTEIVLGPSVYDKIAADSAIDTIKKPEGLNYLAEAINAASEDFDPMTGNAAMIVISDGKFQDEAPVIAARNMAARFGNRVCIHSIFIPSDTADIHQVEADRNMMKRLAAASPCGTFTDARKLLTDLGLKDFVKKIIGGVSAGNIVVKKKKGLKRKKQPAPASITPSISDGDMDGDGVKDSKDKCPGTPKGAHINEFGCWVVRDLLFDSGKWEISPLSYPELDTVVSIFKKNPKMIAEIQGHTDNIGSSAYNLDLSTRRAKSVADYIAGKGISKKRLKYKGYGFKKPITSNNTPEGRSKNRRVEIKPWEGGK